MFGVGKCTAWAKVKSIDCSGLILAYFALRDICEKDFFLYRLVEFRSLAPISVESSTQLRGTAFTASAATGRIFNWNQIPDKVNSGLQINCVNYF